MRIRILIIGVILSIAVIFGGVFIYKNSDEYYKEAAKLIRIEQYDPACDVIKKAIEENGDKADYFILYGMALTGKAEYESAREQFIHVIQNKKGKIHRENNKKAYRGIALTYYKEGIYDQAKAYFELALDTDAIESMNNDLSAYCAECEMYLGEYSKAVKMYSGLIEDKKIDKEEKSAYYMGRANAYMILGEYMASLEDYQNVIDKDNRNFPAYIGKYLALVNTHDTDASEEFLENTIEMLSGSEDGGDKYYLAIFEYYNGNYDVALDYLEESFEENCEDAQYYIGLIYQQQGKYKEAIEKYEEYVAAVPTGRNAEYCNQLAGCYMMLEDYENAVTVLEEGVLLAGGNMKQELLRNRIVAYERTGDYDKALQYIEEYVEQYDDPDMLNELKFIQTRCKEKEQD